MHKYLLYFFCFLSIQYTYSDIFEVYPIYETPPIDTRGDAADDPAFWLNKEFPALSIVFGTDKRAGIYAYNLRGDKITFSPVGQINNIDTRTLNLDFKNNNIKVGIHCLSPSYLKDKLFNGYDLGTLASDVRIYAEGLSNKIKEARS